MNTTENKTRTSDIQRGGDIIDTQNTVNTHTCKDTSTQSDQDTLACAARIRDNTSTTCGHGPDMGSQETCHCSLTAQLHHNLCIPTSKAVSYESFGIVISSKDGLSHMHDECCYRVAAAGYVVLRLPTSTAQKELKHQ